jgi:hypothetical protein
MYVEFHPFYAVHRKENRGRSKGFTSFDHGGGVVERFQINAAKANAGFTQGQQLTPEFLPRIAQRQQHHGAGVKRFLSDVCLDRPGYLLHTAIFCAWDAVCNSFERLTVIVDWTTAACDATGADLLSYRRADESRQGNDSNEGKPHMNKIWPLVRAE